jgi:L-2-hydroxyglutarate oxidase
VALDVVVIGGGILGLATAYRLLEHDPDLSLALVEKERRVAEHQSGRNSNVLHSGLYYRPGSARARLCVDGKREMERYLSEAGIPVLPLGKVVVAVDESEVPRLQELHERGRANGLEGLELLAPGELREREPHVAGVGAVLVPGTAVTNFRRIAERLAEDVRGRGGQLVFGSEVRSARRSGRETVVETPAGGLAARVVVACAGLQADRVAAAMGLRTSERVVPFRGTYRALREGGERLVRGLVYPVPDPGLPFLGVHFTPQADGSVLIGPNAVLAAAREASSRLSISPRDVASSITHPGLWRLAARHLRSGIGEAWRELSDRDFLRACRRYVPELEPRHLGPATFGTRAQLLGRDGELVDDFVIREAPGRVVVLNAPSPAATASLAIGEVIAERVREQLRVA